MSRKQTVPSNGRTLTPWRWLALAGLLVAGIGLQAQSTNGWGVGSTNLDRLAHFWRAVEASNGPVTVLAFGDSMSMAYQSIATQLLWPLRARLGTAGLSITDGTYGITATPSGGASSSVPNTNWWAGHFQLPAGGSIYWTNWDGATGMITADQVGLYWISGPSGGRFTFSVSTNRGATWQPLAALEGASPALAGHATNFAVPRLPCCVRVDGVSGTNVIIAPQFLDRTSSGINVAFMAYPGANLDQIFALPANVSYPILSALNPQLVIWHMKELGDLGAVGLSNRLFDLERMWKACVTNGDVLYLGTPYDFRDASGTYTGMETRLVKQAAERDQRAYLDCMTPCHSYAWMASQGYMNDAVHPNNPGNAYLAGLAWRELTWSALRVDRRLTIQPGADGSQCFTWPTASNLTYELQASADLLNWSVVHTAAGDGNRHVFTHAPAIAGNRSFRLKLTGN